jgi:ABC-type nickel/cobalt efflux system permease component RcnA
MDSTLPGLVATCAAMFLGAFLAGMSCYKLNRRQLAWLNCFAAGLLLGTALGVIIPEGVRSIYEGSKAERMKPTVVEEIGHGDHDHDHDHDHQGHENSHQERLLGKDSAPKFCLSTYTRDWNKDGRLSWDFSL